MSRRRDIAARNLPEPTTAPLPVREADERRPPSRGTGGGRSLEELFAQARTVVMSEADREAQTRSFVYGNLKIENDRITRAMIDEVAERLGRPAAR